MKKVFNKKQLIEAFIAQKEESARSTSDMYFRGVTIYSYGSHFPICILDVVKKVAIFNTQRYSNTTAKHQSLVKYAVIEAGFDLISIESLSHAALTTEQCKKMIEVLEQHIPLSPDEESNLHLVHKWLCHRVLWKPTMVKHYTKTSIL